ncbi:MAG: pyrimidine/purine nucleoside phosphorylase [bacterium]|nr:pyrimidine/purine nucleoside phosphorylase [bacterium]MDZ4247754.1 pyrimidine/purine nucleoside phosphorylase [Patescibacteria group bacterium]
MTTPDYQPEHDELTRQHPDNVYFDGDVISWEYRTPDGTRATLGIVQPGFKEVFKTDEGGENIRLYDSDGTQSLRIWELKPTPGGDQVVMMQHLLGDETEAEIPGGIYIQVKTPEDQGPVAYVCEYPGIRNAE